MAILTIHPVEEKHVRVVLAPQHDPDQPIDVMVPLSRWQILFRGILPAPAAWLRHINGYGRVEMENLHDLLAEFGLTDPGRMFSWQRDENNPNLADPGAVFFWPTDIRGTTQDYNTNEFYDYTQWGLEGHEGIDLRAPLGTGIYAVHDGLVISSEDMHEGIKKISDGSPHPYGKHVRLLHLGVKGLHNDLVNLITIYAHLSVAEVIPNINVERGQQIGQSGNTGNSDGAHLHLTLKQQGADPKNVYPRLGGRMAGDIIDPTPWLFVK